MNAQDKATKFMEGKVYFARSTGDYDSIAEMKVVRVTATQVVFIYHGQEMRRKFNQRENHQRVQVDAGYAAYSNHVLEEEVIEAESDEKEILEPEIETAKDVAVAIEEQAAEADTLTAEDAPDYRDKEILIIMHCPVKGHKVARLVSINMFSIPDYNAAKDWECNVITEDEGKRVELIKQWIDDRANEQHESNLEFVKYEIVKEGVFAERDLNRQFRLEAEKQNCESVAEAVVEAVPEIQETEAAEAKPVDSSESEAKKLAIAAEIIGWQAFKDGKKCVPALDRNLDSLLENLPAGTGLAIMIYTRWARGWTDANLAAPVVCEDEAPAAEAAQVESEEPEAESRQSTRSIVAALKESNQDFEYYPTTQEMLDCIRRDMREGVDQKAYSVLEVGAGTAFAGKFLAGGEKVLAIEKSEILRASWPCDVIPVGADFDNLSMIGIKADVCFCNPPYSAYEAWAARIINEFSGGRVYLVIPQRWENSDLIRLAIEDRKASSKVIFSGDFLEAERSARAKVDIVCIDLRQGEYGSRRFTKVDPFELWYEKEFKREPEQAQDEQKINIDIDETGQVVAGESYIERISSLYSAELNTLQQAFQSINGLSGKVFKLLNLSRGSLCEALKAEINGIRAKYWNELFKKYKPISSRLTSHGLQCLRGQFSAQESIDFAVDNILAATVWAIKYANKMNSEQLEVFVLQLFDKANIINYKSNQRTFEKEDWRYSKHEKAKSYSHYGLDYRIVLENAMPFPYREGFSYSYDYPNGLSKRCHDLVNDLLVISRNLGYESDGVTSYHHDWNPGKKKHFYFKNGDTAFTVKGYIKGTMHFQINQEIVRAMNVEFGRLKGWIKDKRQAAEELGISEAEAEKAWGSPGPLLPPAPSLMLGM